MFQITNPSSHQFNTKRCENEPKPSKSVPLKISFNQPQVKLSWEEQLQNYRTEQARMLRTINREVTKISEQKKDRECDICCAKILSVGAVAITILSSIACILAVRR